MSDEMGDRRPSFTEAQLLVLVGAVWLAVEVALPAPALIAVVAVAGGYVSRRRWLVAIAVVVLASALSHGAEEAYRLAERRTLDGEAATIVLDAEPSRFGWRAEAKLEATGQRVRLIGSGFDTPDLSAGTPIVVSGRLGPVEPSAWSKSRHIVGAVTVTEVESTGRPAWYLRPGEWLRAGVLGSTASFPSEHRALYHGLVIGDDRFQTEGQQAEFRASGLSHLLAVSGQNVAFLLAVASPMVGRLRPGVDLVVIAALLATFALATRLEPSVLRATVTASIGVVAVARSSRAAGVRALALAVIALLLLDPFLAASVGFRLSVAASAGILLFAAPLRDLIAVPSPVASPLSVTLAAQAGVTPLLIATFGPVSTVTVPANLLAGWAAGAVMTLGLSVGLVAAVVPAPVATALQVPSRWLVWWIDVVADVSAQTAMPVVGAATVPAIFAVGTLCWWRRPTRLLERAAFVAMGFAVLFITSPSPAELVGWHPRTSTTPSVLVVEGAGPDPDELIAAGVRQIDIVVVERGNWSAARAVDRMREVTAIDVVLAPGDHRIVGGRRVVGEVVLPVGDGSIRIRPGPDGLEIETVVGRQATG